MKKIITSNSGSVLIPIMLAATVIAGIAMYAVQRFRDDLKVAKTVEIKNEYDTIMNDLSIILASTDACTQTFQGWSPEDNLERPQVIVYSKDGPTAPAVEEYRSNLNYNLSTKYGPANIRIRHIKMSYPATDPFMGFNDPTDLTKGYTYLRVGFHPDNRRLGTVVERRIRLQVVINSVTNRTISSCTVAGSADMGNYLPLAGGRMQGNITMPDGTQIEFLSDRRLKEQISPIENSLPQVLRLNPVSYDWKLTGKRSFGLIAQEVSQIYPNLVRDEGHLVVNYHDLIPFMVNSLQELDHENKELKKVYRALEKEHSEIRKYLCKNNQDSKLCGVDQENDHGSSIQ